MSHPLLTGKKKEELTYLAGEFGVNINKLEDVRISLSSFKEDPKEKAKRIVNRYMYKEDIYPYTENQFRALYRLTRALMGSVGGRITQERLKEKKSNQQTTLF